MKKPSLKSILTVVAVLLFATFAAACAQKPKEKPYDYLVTFNYNVGEIVADADDQYLGVKSGGKVGLQPNQGAFEGKTVQGYYVEGWYLPQLDGNGNPVVGDDKRVALDKKWDFTADTVSKDITLYANLVRFSKLIVKIEGEDDIEHAGALGATATKPSEKNRRYPKKEGWTFIDYYEDADYQTPFDWSKPYTYTAEDKTVYAKFIEGEWYKVYRASDFAYALNSTTDNVYLMNDIDVAENIKNDSSWWGGSKTRTWTLDGRIIEGNNHKITGIKRDFEYARNYTSAGYALFARLTSKSEIRNLTIEGAEVSVKKGGTELYPGEINVALLVAELEAGAKLTNVKVSGKITVAEIDQEEYYTEWQSLTVGGACAIDKGAVIQGCDFTGITVDNKNPAKTE